MQGICPAYNSPSNVFCFFPHVFVHSIPWCTIRCHFAQNKVPWHAIVSHFPKQSHFSQNILSILPPFCPKQSTMACHYKPFPKNKAIYPQTYYPFCQNNKAIFPFFQNNVPWHNMVCLFKKNKAIFPNTYVQFLPKQNSLFVFTAIFFVHLV